MDQVTFAMPVSSTMSRQDQIDLLVNQAAAVIISNYLLHLNTVINKAATLTYPYFANEAILSPPELVTLINDVQGALRTIP